MGWIFFTVLMTAAFWAGIATWLWGRRAEKATADDGDSYNNSSAGMIALTGIGIAVVSVLIWGLATAAMTLKTVGQREVAIIYNFSGTIAGQERPGVVTTFPWQHVRKENVGIQHNE